MGMTGINRPGFRWRRERDSNFTTSLTPRKLLISGYAKRGKTGKNAHRRHELGTARSFTRYTQQRWPVILACLLFS
jgi:hypothetical protein